MRLHLVDADSGGGHIDADKSSVSIIVRPRSNPCGSVSFAKFVYTVVEPDHELTQFVRFIRTYVMLSALVLMILS